MEFQAVPVLTKELKEEILNQKMATMRLQNEAIERRHKEIEEDKKKAEKNASSITSSRQNSSRVSPPARSSNSSYGPTKKYTEKLRSSPEQNNAGSCETPKNRITKRSPLADRDSDEKPRARRGERGSHGEYRAPADIEPTVTSPNSSDGPPPDPKFNFLMDDQRSGPLNQGYSEPSEREHRRERAQRHPRNYGGADLESVHKNIKNYNRRKYQSYRTYDDKSPTELEMSVQMSGKERRQHAEWKAERDRIDQERLKRHQRADGNWSREWDDHKNETEFLEMLNCRSQPARRPAGRIGSGRFVVDNMSGGDNAQSRDMAKASNYSSRDSSKNSTDTKFLSQDTNKNYNKSSPAKSPSYSPNSKNVSPKNESKQTQKSPQNHSVKTSSAEIGQNQEPKIQQDLSEHEKAHPKKQRRERNSRYGPKSKLKKSPVNDESSLEKKHKESSPIIEHPVSNTADSPSQRSVSRESDSLVIKIRNDLTTRSSDLSPQGDTVVFHSTDDSGMHGVQLSSSIHSSLSSLRSDLERETSVEPPEPSYVNPAEEIWELDEPDSAGEWEDASDEWVDVEESTSRNVVGRLTVTTEGEDDEHNSSAESLERFIRENTLRVDRHGNYIGDIAVSGENTAGGRNAAAAKPKQRVSSSSKSTKTKKSRVKSSRKSKSAGVVSATEEFVSVSQISPEDHTALSEVSEQNEPDDATSAVSQLDNDIKTEADYPGDNSSNDDVNENLNTDECLSINDKSAENQTDSAPNTSDDLETVKIRNTVNNEHSASTAVHIDEAKADPVIASEIPSPDGDRAGDGKDDNTDVSPTVPDVTTADHLTTLSGEDRFTDCLTVIDDENPHKSLEQNADQSGNDGACDANAAEVVSEGQDNDKQASCTE